MNFEESLNKLKVLKNLTDETHKEIIKYCKELFTKGDYYNSWCVSEKLMKTYNYLFEQTKKRLKNNEMVSYKEIPIEVLMDFGVSLKKPNWMLYALQNDPDLKDYENFDKRENANFHKLNEILDPFEKIQRITGTIYEF